MKKSATRIAVILGLLALSGVIVTFAQEHAHDHSQASQSTPSGGSLDEVAVFCPTMKTGQLCSQGTANVLHLTGDKKDQWLQMAHKYNKAVDAATLELFKDSETTLTPEQQKQLKAWFAVGLNPEINDLLYGKGLAPKPQPGTHVH